MAEATNYRYGMIRSLDEAREAAAEAEADGLLGWYPAACVVLARELKRWEEAHAAWLESQASQEPKGNRCGCNWWLTKPCPSRNCPWQGKRPVDAGVQEVDRG